jgi:putative transposase
MLTVNRLGLPLKLRRSLACTNSIENMMGTVRRVCRNVKRWRNAAMALRWTAAGLMEAAKGFRRLKAYRHLPVLRAALATHQTKSVGKQVEDSADAALHHPPQCLPRLLQQNLGHPQSCVRHY